MTDQPTDILGDTPTMNPTSALIAKAAASSDPLAAIERVRRHVATLERLDLTEPEAISILDNSATLALKAGMTAEAAQLEEAGAALRRGDLIPRQWYFGWLPAAPAVAGTPTLTPDAAKAAQPVGPQEVVVVSMPPRVTRTVVHRDNQGRIVETTQVQEDVP